MVTGKVKGYDHLDFKDAEDYGSVGGLAVMSSVPTNRVLTAPSRATTCTENGKLGARLSVRRKKSRVVQLVPENQRRILNQSRPRYRSPQRESHPYDDVHSVAARESGPYDEVLYRPDVSHNPRCESQQYDDVFHRSARGNEVSYSPRREHQVSGDVFHSSARRNEVSYSPRREHQVYDDVCSSPLQRAAFLPPRVDKNSCYRVRSSNERQSRECIRHYRDYYNIDLVREPTGSSKISQVHGRASRSHVRESTGYVTPNAIAQWQVAAFREELARERSESIRKNSMQRSVRKYTFQSRFAKT
ncbi:uncharacterized protein LOC125035893 [Penaeus chinensis]|uniref:uncharacterized protein LOC125035893 n=1 Tax=Penaeus chinensis TaxID=139456 RepID=UPI001FB7B06D|nr:uncharacterized protein LOC125035893 [Penaeus chinensis]